VSNLDQRDVLVQLDSVGLSYRYSWTPWSKKYNRALHNVSLSIRRGEKLGIIGRNGAGKSSLMRVFAGIFSPDQGQVIRHSEKSLMLSLQVGFQRHLTGRENAMLSGLYQGISRREIEALMPKIQAYAEIGEHFDQPISTYSMGMRSRLGIATAIHCQPDLLILDEVFAVGDRVFKQKSRDTLIAKIQSDHAVILASHDNDLIGLLCEKVVWLVDGEVQLLGSPDEVLPRYEAYCEDVKAAAQGQQS
jgi:lipopolysaccharide transport system ATP-binding protein